MNNSDNKRPSEQRPSEHSCATRTRLTVPVIEEQNWNLKLKTRVYEYAIEYLPMYPHKNFVEALNRLIEVVNDAIDAVRGESLNCEDCGGRRRDDEPNYNEGML